MSRSWEITYESKKKTIMVRRKIKKHKETTEYFRIKKKEIRNTKQRMGDQQANVIFFAN